MSDDEQPGDEELVLGARTPARRRRTHVVAVVVGVVAAAVAVPLALAGAGPRAQLGRQLPTTSSSSLHLEERPGGLRWFDERAQIYAAAIDNRARGPADAYVLDRICRAVPTRPADESCAGGLIPQDVRGRLAKLLGGRVRFVEHVLDPAGAADPPVVVLGALAITGNRARLGIEVMCGPLCGQGETLVLARSSGVWAVTGTAGSGWIS